MISLRSYFLINEQEPPSTLEWLSNRSSTGGSYDDFALHRANQHREYERAVRSRQRINDLENQLIGKKIGTKTGTKTGTNAGTNATKNTTNVTHKNITKNTTKNTTNDDEISGQEAAGITVRKGASRIGEEIGNIGKRVVDFASEQPGAAGLAGLAAGAGAAALAMRKRKQQM